MNASAPVTDIATTVAGVRLALPAMNAAGVWAATTGEVRALAASEAGALVLRSATVHPFVHPEYRTLHNPGFDKLVPFVAEVIAHFGRPVVPSIAGASVDEYITLARAFADVGVAWIEADLDDAYVHAALAPFDEPGKLRDLATRLAAATPVPIALRLPERLPVSRRQLVGELIDSGVRVLVVRNDFEQFEKLALVTGDAFEFVVVGGIRFGLDVTRALGKGARAVQVRSTLLEEGPAVFARLGNELRLARRGQTH